MEDTTGEVPWRLHQFWGASPFQCSLRRSDSLVQTLTEFFFLWSGFPLSVRPPRPWWSHALIGWPMGYAQRTNTRRFVPVAGSFLEDELINTGVHTPGPAYGQTTLSLTSSARQIWRACYQLISISISISNSSSKQQPKPKYSLSIGARPTWRPKD